MRQLYFSTTYSTNFIRHISFTNIHKHSTTYSTNYGTVLYHNLYSTNFITTLFNKLYSQTMIQFYSTLSFNNFITTSFNKLYSKLHPQTFQQTMIQILITDYSALISKDCGTNFIPNFIHNHFNKL